ncbi:sulfotransferase family 2 domain-containing protein [Arthrospira platensis SPKY1]|nr:sulfotransferase family 2 domain-containing protein [Arthrospira platensis SPKY1]
MRISHKYKFVFLANPQSGSTSIRRILNPYSDIKSCEKPPYVHHINARKLKEHFQSMSWDWGSYFKFTTIRNPWSKMVGRYHYGLKNTASVWHKPASNAKNFSDFLDHPIVQRLSRETRIDNFAFDKSGDCLVDQILKMEDMDSQLTAILKNLGIEIEKVIKINTTEHDHYSLYYNDVTRNSVAEMFAFDINYGNYQFEDYINNGVKHE